MAAASLLGVPRCSPAACFALLGEPATCQPPFMLGKPDSAPVHRPQAHRNICRQCPCWLTLAGSAVPSKDCHLSQLDPVVLEQPLSPDLPGCHGNTETCLTSRWN